MITEYHSTGYKTGPAGSNIWDITFDDLDFTNAVGASWLNGPFSLAIDVDATNMGYPLMLGLELVTVAGSISVGDRTHIAFASRERRVISSASVPQLAYITGTVKKIIVHCYGYSSNEGLGCKIALRIGPAAVITAPQEMIGRDTLAFNPSVYFSVDSGVVAVNPGLPQTLFSITANPISGLRFNIVAVSLVLYPTPSFPGDLLARIEIVTRVATVEPVHIMYSRDDQFAFYRFDDNLFLDVGFTLRCIVENSNSANAYQCQAQVTYITQY